MGMISIENISFSYNYKEKVLKNISEKIFNGEFLSILGPNGCGKTTLLRCLNKLLTPQNGSIKIDGKDLDQFSMNSIAQKIAYVPQILNNVFPASVYDTVLTGRKPHIEWRPGEKDRDIVSEIIIQLDLEHIALKDINQLSGGQRQRVFIGRALAQQPEIMLLDEPTANLDLHHQHEVMELLQNLSNKGMTIITSIHDLNLALQYCKRFFMMTDGQIIARGGKEIFFPELLEKVYKMKLEIFKMDERMIVFPQK